ncbi:MAG: alpha/beta hydrolase [Rhodospirillaceae bacterium]|jgi:pimeloyl-ACP methyl ester carboxylesterase|nr:alpha/beta hydrolase [Rhodospirillaceae bacterium]MBT5458156.1 alpha/beta hydrolase [Rhodospirillaceae bacterium]
MIDTPRPANDRSQNAAPKILTRADGTTIAYHKSDGKGPGVIFLGGFKSDMTGTKAVALEAHCRAAGRAFLRFDYQGHGESSGRFENGTISQWAEDAIAVLDEVTEGPQVLVGSSMGGWIMLLAALARPDRVAALVGIAAAPDFTESLMWQHFSPETRETLLRDGVFSEPSDYDDEPYIITLKLIEDGRDNLLLERPIAIHCPVRLIQGMADSSVPWEHGLALAEKLLSEHVTLTLVKDGDHRLSRDEDIARLLRILDTTCDEVGQDRV